jgi:quercetin dioxygenase-like cupin family protein
MAVESAMRQALLFLLALCALAAAQKPAPIPDSNVEQRKVILENSRVTVTRFDFAPGEAIPMHQHTHDIMAVFIDGGRLRETVEGRKPSDEKMYAGEVRFHPQGYAHSTKNLEVEPFRVAVVEFADLQGKLEKAAKPKKTRYCNTGSKTVCVDENELFCTAKVCVEDVVMAPGAVTTKHSHTTDHMLVAISGYELTDTIEGKGTSVRTRRSGEVEYISAGITHQLTNTGKQPAHFVVVLWR